MHRLGAYKLVKSDLVFKINRLFYFHQVDISEMMIGIPKRYAMLFCNSLNAETYWGRNS